MNFGDEEYKIPDCFSGKTDLLTGEEIGNGEMIPKYGVRLVSIKK